MNAQTHDHQNEEAFNWQYAVFNLAERALPWMVAKAIEMAPKVVSRKPRSIFARKRESHPGRIIGAIAVGAAVTGLVLYIKSRAHEPQDAHTPGMAGAIDVDLH